MKLAMTLLVRDEADILEANLSYHLDQGVDMVIATDNDSQDGSLEILERYEDLGCLRLFRRSGDLRQQEWVNHMVQVAVELGADWVINNDADEFWWPRAGTLAEVFAAIPPEIGLLAAPRTRFVARPEESGFFADRLTTRRFESPWQPEVGEGVKTAHRARTDVTVGRGSHRVSGGGLRALPGWHPVFVFHFQAREHDRFVLQKTHHGGALDRTLPSVGQAVQFRALRERGVSYSDVYRMRVWDDAKVRRGIEQRRLVVDERLSRFLSGRPPSGVGKVEQEVAELNVGTGSADPSAPPELADIWEDLMVSLKEWGKVQKRLEKAERRAAKAERRGRTAAARLELIEGGVAWRLRARALGLVHAVRRRRA